MAWIYGDFGLARLFSKTGLQYSIRDPKDLDFMWECSRCAQVFWTTTKTGAGGNRPSTSLTKTTWAFGIEEAGIGGSGGFNVPATKEFWLRFDVYNNTSNTGTDPLQNGIFAGNAIYNDTHYLEKSTGYTGILVSPSRTRFYNYDSTTCKYELRKGFPRRTLHTCLLHMRSGATNGLCEFWLDGELFDTYTGNVNNGQYFNCIGIGSTDYGATGFIGQAVYFSRVLISNEQIGFDYPTVHWYEIVNEDVARNIIEATEVSVDVDVIRKIVDCVFDLDVERNISAELIFSPLNTEEILHGSSAALKLQSGLRDSGTITATSFDSNEIEQNTMSERNTSGTQSVEINIAEQQLTDQVTFTSIIQYTIMQYISGQYFDYLYKLRIESRQQQGILFTYRCCSNIDELLYTQIAYKVTSTETIQDDTQEQASEDTEDKSIEEEEAALLETGEYHTLTENAVAVATYFGLTPVVQLGEFAEFYSSYKEQDLWGRTYADAIREVFGWSSRIPHKLINVYIRDDKMFFIQRGSESKVIDISKTAHTVPLINQELVRTFWGSTPWSETEIKEKILGTRGLGGSGDSDNDDFPADYINNDDDDDDKDNPWSAVGTVVTSDSAGTSITEYDYTSNGVLRGTTTTFTSNGDSSQNSTTVVRNSYNADGLLEAVQTTVTHSSAPEEDKQTVVKYGYLSLSGGQKFLASELTAEYERNSEGFFELVDTRATTKSPTGRGQGTSYDSKGKGTASGNVGDDRVTPYQLRSSFNTTSALSVQTLKRTTTTTINGFTDIDPSFPLLLLRDRATITEYLKWLNRKTKETVSVSVYDFGHIIDFNDRIILDSKEYFVVSNNVRTTPRLYNEQNLTLVRWF